MKILGAGTSDSSKVALKLLTENSTDSAVLLLFPSLRSEDPMGPIKEISDYRMHNEQGLFAG